MPSKKEQRAKNPPTTGTMHKLLPCTLMATAFVAMAQTCAKPLLWVEP
jgi:hypothetical protein